MDQIERIARCVAIFGDYNGYSFADVTNFIHGKDIVFGYSERGVIGGGRKRADLIAQFRAGENGDDASLAARCIRVDAVDCGMRVRASEDRNMEHIGKPDIVHVLPEPANEAGIFAPLDAGANGFAYGHGVFSLSL
jgi:hypothetical protein